MTVPAQQSENVVGVSDKEILLGSCAPLSGRLGSRGQQYVSGGKAYFAYINEHGGVHGRQIKLISCDDKYDADAAIDCFDRHLKGRVFLGTLFQGTAAAAKYVRMSDSYHMPMVGFGTGAEFIIDPVHPYVFQLRGSYRNEAFEQVRTLTKRLGKRKIALVFQNDAYGAAVRTAFEEAMNSVNVKPVTIVPIERLSDDVQSVVEQLNAAKPDAVIVAATTALPLIIKRKREIESNPLIVTLSISTDVLTKALGKEAEGTLITQVVPLIHDDLPAVQLYKKVLAKYEHQPPSYSSFEGFLIAMVVVEGLKRSERDLTREKFVKALESIQNYDMGLGHNLQLNFSAKIHDGLRGGIYWTRIKDGKVSNINDWSLIR
jgi:branched-chain amino acid transport system substrate-binding protein